MALIPGVDTIVAGSAVLANETTLLTESVSSRIAHLVASAARSLRAGGAHFATGSTADAQTLSLPGGTTFDVGAAPELARAALAERLLVIDRAERNGTLSGVLYEAELHFFASVRIGAEAAPAGYLALYAREPRSLSAAERCVLLTFAAEIHDQLAFSSATLCAPQDRLRSIESVIADSQDATLVTEAEPIDSPGPRIVFANAAFTRITGREAREVVGHTPGFLHGSEADDSVRERLRVALQTRQPVEVELRNHRNDQASSWEELSIAPIADENGSLTQWVWVQRDITERKASEAAAARIRSASNAELDYRVFHDGLTGLRNRAYFYDRVETLLKRIHEDGGQRFAILYFDIDHFKAINESFGHRASDRLLIEFARRLEGCIRSRDTLARLGSDEFTCLIEAEDLADVIAVAERILAALRTPIVLAARETFASTSIGIAYVDAGYQRASDIFRDAGAAMSRAKSNGGMRYELFNEAMHADALAALRVQIDLSRALERNEFQVYYQPLVDLHAGHAYGLEALVRWRHPERGLVPPIDFIPVAEETGLIVSIGSWVLHEACRRMRLWHDEAPESEKLTLSVNVSSRQLFDPGFLLELEHALAESGLDPRTLILEITESIFLDSAQDFRALLERIKTLGVRIALDDFGTGYSSLSYLERFRFDTLKIDKSFVARLLSVRATAEIVRLIIGLAGALEMEVVAEGIEDAEQWKALRALGCVRAQGYHFSRPVAEADVAALLARPLATQPRS